MKNICEELKSLVGDSATIDWVKAKLLYEIKETNAFEEEYQTWDNYLAEIQETRHMANRLMRVYKHYIINLGFTLEEMANYGSYAMADEVRKVSTNKKEAKKWLGKIKTTLREHLRQDMLEATTGIKLEDCEHEWKYSKRCKKCGDWEIVENFKTE